MRRFLFLGLLLMLLSSAKAQTPVEVFAGNRGVVHEFWFFKPFAEQSAFSWFSFTNVTVPYQRTPEGALQPQLVVSGFLTYDLVGGFGFAASSNLANGGVSYVLGAQYTLGIDSLSFLFVSTGIDVRRNPNADVFLQFVYQPALNDWARLFVQLIALSNFNFQAHNFSQQNVRFGLSVNSYQFGIGAVFSQLGSPAAFESNLGLFIRKEF